MRAIARAIVRGAVAHQLTGPGLGGGWTPAQWFLASEQGAWYDPSDVSTMFQDSFGTVPVTAVEQPVGLVLDKSGNGNHAYQATAAARPVLSARKNLLTKSEQFDNAAWVKNRTTAAAAVNGFSRITEDGTATASHGICQSATAATVGAVATCSILVKKAATRNICLWIGSIAANPTDGYRKTIDLTAGVVSATAVNGTGVVEVATTITSHDATTWRISTTMQIGSGGTAFGVLLCLASGTAAGGEFYDGNSTSYIDLGSAQLEYGTVATTYQRVTTATDYDTVGFPHYFALDRVDDHLTVATGGGGTTGICVCAAIRTGGAGNARTIWSDRGTNTGYRLSINASNQLVLSAGNGSTHTEVVGPTVTAGTDYVVTGWHDGTNLNVQVNAGATTSAAFGTAAAGTAGFTIGKDNGAAAGYYGDRIYEIVYRKDDTSSAGDRTSLITYMAEQAGITL